MARRTSAVLGLAGAGALLICGPARAIHVGVSADVGVEFTGTRPAANSPTARGCVASGVVANDSTQMVTVRVLFRAWEARGGAFQATARVVRVKSSERREFVSSPFVQRSDGSTPACSALQQVEILETVTDAVP